MRPLVNKILAAVDMAMETSGGDPHGAVPAAEQGPRDA